MKMQEMCDYDDEENQFVYHDHDEEDVNELVAFKYQSNYLKTNSEEPTPKHSLKKRDTLNF